MIGNRLFLESNLSQLSCTDFVCEDLLLFSKIHGVMAESEETKMFE